MVHLGAGTQRLEQEVRIKFPDVKALRMDSDSMRRPGSHDTALEAFRRGEVQILLGTQMIAKGLDFPHVTLVGVVDADTTLHQPDLRAAERTFQLVSQVAGRTGRSMRGGRVLVQTTSPTEPCILKAAEHDYEGFARHELEHRRRLDMPPYQHLVRVVLRGPEEAAVREFAASACAVVRELADRQASVVRVLGPAPAPIAKLKKNYRHHFQLASAEIEILQRLWRTAAEHLPKKSGVEYSVDVDPMDMR
jgi:primosomal protein N' (replication factor Y)